MNASLPRREAIMSNAEFNLNRMNKELLDIYNELNNDNNNEVQNIVRSQINDIHQSVYNAIQNIKYLDLLLSTNHTSLTEVAERAKAVKQ